MTVVQEILKLIETVSPDDAAKLDEIDARVSHYIHDKVFIRWMGGGSFNKYSDKYTRSRDALKEIRPNGFYFQLQEFNNGVYGAALTDKIIDKTQVFKPEYCLRSTYLPTEELAELHAIISAIEYERNGG